MSLERSRHCPSINRKKWTTRSLLNLLYSTKLLILPWTLPGFISHLYQQSSTWIYLIYLCQGQTMRSMLAAPERTMISTKLREGTCKIVKAPIEAVAWVNIVQKKRCDLTHCDHVSAFIIAGVDWFAVYLNLWLSLCILPCSYPLERKYAWLPELFSLPPFDFAVSYDIVLKCLLLMTYVCLCLCMFFCLPATY